MRVEEFNHREQSIEDEAAEWVIRLGQRSITHEERQAFDLWINQDPHHAQAFDFAQRTWTKFETLQNYPELIGGLQNTNYQGEERQPKVTQPRRLNLRTWGAIAASFLLVSLVGLTQYDTIRTMFLSDYRTGIGEIRMVLLPDGSQVELNTKSAITLHFDDQRRQVELLSGEAVFTAAPVTEDEPRPFVVKASRGYTRAVGTQFNIRLDDRGAHVTGIEHEVVVSQSSALRGNSPSVRLSPGHSVRYGIESGLGAIQSADVEQITAWRRGHIVFNRVTLEQVVTEINRYHPGWIVVGNEELTRQRVSGVFRVDDIHAAVHTIASELNADTASIGSLATLVY